MRPTILVVLTATLACTAHLAAQRPVPLPHGSGALVAPADWTVLGAADLAAPQRVSDPTDEPARTLLLTMLAELQSRSQTADHLVLHAKGKRPGDLRSVNCYGTAARATTADLQQESTVRTMQEAYVAETTKAGSAVTFLGHDDPRLFPTGSLRLRFESRHGDSRNDVHLHVVPAGERVQYFEVMAAREDTEGLAAIESVLRTFDGAKEAKNDITRTLILGGISGAVAGMAFALLRRFLQERNARKAGAARGSATVRG
jgi:hypothetical protein